MDVAPSWLPDRLLPGHEVHTFAIPGAVPLTQEGAGALTGTLIRRAERQPSAVVYLHGWNDYFFHTHISEYAAALGVDFYALELRRYGRNLRPGLLAGYIDDLADYNAEIDYAMKMVTRDHQEVAIAGHSTGGLIAALWAADHPGSFTSLLLNSPWLRMSGSTRAWRLRRPMIDVMAKVSPTTVVPREEDGLYRRSLSAEQDGEWTYDPDRKSSPQFKMRFGWLSAILAGQERIRKGLNIAEPILVMISARSAEPTEWDASLLFMDIVLDLDKIASYVGRLGDQVTLRRLDGALHDVFLSVPAVRQQAFREVTAWAHQLKSRKAP